MLSSENARHNRGARYANESYKRICSKRQGHICRVIVFVSHGVTPLSRTAHSNKKATEKVAAAIHVAMRCFMLALRLRRARHEYQSLGRWRYKSCEQASYTDASREL